MLDSICPQSRWPEFDKMLHKNCTNSSFFSLKGFVNKPASS